MSVAPPKRQSRRASASFGRSLRLPLSISTTSAVRHPCLVNRHGGIEMREYARWLCAKGCAAAAGNARLGCPQELGAGTWRGSPHRAVELAAELYLELRSSTGRENSS